MPRIMISAGETSGDIHAASVVRSMHQVNPAINWSGMGGSAMAEQGVELIVDFSSLAVMGYVDVLLNYRKLRKRLSRLEQALHRQRPDLLLLVDYASFNLKLAETARTLDIPVLFYIGPKVWASRPGRIKTIKRLVNHMALILPFEKALYQSNGIAATYVGNPLIEQIAIEKDRVKARQQLGLLQYNTQHENVGETATGCGESCSDIHYIGLLPGSRQSELNYNLPRLLEAARMLSDQRQHPCKFIIPLATALAEEQLEKLLADYADLDLQIISDQSHQVMRACDVMMVASGTATLEAAVIGTPMVALYIMHWLNYQIMRRLVISDYVTLVNIQANAPVVKELIQSQATAEALCEEVNRLLDDRAYRQHMIDRFARIHNDMLGMSTQGTTVATPGSTSERVAHLALDLITQKNENLK